MAIGVVRKGSIGTSQRQASQASRIPSSSKGIDARTPFAADAPEVCIYTYNLVPNDGGMRLRKGFREWQVGLDNGSGLSVNSIIPYNGIPADGSDDRVFAVTNEGIWDITTAGAAPVLKVTFSTQTASAGFGPQLNFVTDAGAKLLAYADSLNGLFAYDASTDTWAQPTNITDVDETRVNFIAEHKGRIWLIERESTVARYLAIGAIAGPTTEFAFGSKFRSGGLLQGLFSWTVDGGIGVDDLLVGASSAGDIIIYKGDDPSSATWAVRGVYSVGDLPKGPNFATQQGGELYVLSSYGVISMADLLAGVSISSASADNTSAKIAGELRARMTTQISLDGWHIERIPSEGGLLISTPTVPGTDAIQYYYNLTVGGWGLWRSLDIRCFGTWKNSVMFGDGSLRVCYMDQEADEVLLTPPAAPAVNAKSIQFSMLTTFNTLGSPSLFKRVKYVRPDVVSLVEPSYNATARYDYRLAEANLNTLTAPNKVGLWNTDVWDAAVWGSTGATGWSSVYGSFGTGRNVAIAYRGDAFNAFTLVGWDIIYDVGGPT
jgi:hypothetical protein